MESLAHLDAGIDLGEGHTVDDSAWLQAAAGAANESSGSDQDYDQDDDQDDEDEGDNEDEELNQRHFGIFKALPVGDGDPDWSLGERLLTPPLHSPVHPPQQATPCAHTHTRVCSSTTIPCPAPCKLHHLHASDHIKTCCPSSCHVLLCPWLYAPPVMPCGHDEV